MYSKIFINESIREQNIEVVWTERLQFTFEALANWKEVILVIFTELQLKITYRLDKQEVCRDCTLCE